MAGSLQCTLTTPEAKVFEGAVRFVVVPVSDGELGILPRHAPLVGCLGFGELRLESEAGDKTPYFVDGGFLQVLDNHVSVLAARAVPLSSLDFAAEEASLNELEGAKPGADASSEARDEYARSLGVARARVRLAKRAR